MSILDHTSGELIDEFHPAILYDVVDISSQKRSGMKSQV